MVVVVVVFFIVLIVGSEKTKEGEREKMQMGFEEGVRERDFSFLLVLPCSV